MTSGVFVLGGVVYCVIGSGTIQPWARQHPTPSTIDHVPLDQKDHQAPAMKASRPGGSIDEHNAVAS